MKNNKKYDGDGKIIGLSRDYFREILPGQYILLEKNPSGKYTPRGGSKSAGDLFPFMERGIYRKITSSAKNNLLSGCSSKKVVGIIKKLEIVLI
jgi:hypothetical protein